MPYHRAPARVSAEFAPVSATSWVIVLAGGQGERLVPFVREWLGEERPKQYCRFVGDHSMLEHTLARAHALVPDAHVLTVAAPNHRTFLDELGRTDGVVYQPRDCGTAPGIFLPLTAIAAADPHALVHVMPSDHFIHPRDRFLRHLVVTENVVRAAPECLVLTTAVPDVAETDFGWIQPGRAIAGAGWAALSVAAFHEKPDAALAARYLKCGYLWNTMIISCTVETLWRLATDHLPDMLTRFDAMQRAWSTPRREQTIRETYGTMPHYDFSRDLLEQSTAECLLVPLQGIAWSDWGRPSRIAASVDEFGLQPNYSRSPTLSQISRLAS